MIDFPKGGKVELNFVRNNRVIVAPQPLAPVKINGDEYAFRFCIGLIDGEWKQCQEGNQGNPYSSSNCNVRCSDWNRKTGPSGAAIRRIGEWAESLVAEFATGKYTKELATAEIEFINREIANCHIEINKLRDAIEDKLKEIAKHEAMLPK